MMLHLVAFLQRIDANVYHRSVQLLHRHNQKMPKLFSAISNFLPSVSGTQGIWPWDANVSINRKRKSSSKQQEVIFILRFLEFGRHVGTLQHLLKVSTNIFSGKIYFEPKAAQTLSKAGQSHRWKQNPKRSRNILQNVLGTKCLGTVHRNNVASAELHRSN